MPANGQNNIANAPKILRFVVEESPAKVLSVLASMGCTQEGPDFLFGVEWEPIKVNVAKVKLNSEALDFLIRLAGGNGDQVLNLASLPRTNEHVAQNAYDHCPSTSS